MADEGLDYENVAQFTEQAREFMRAVVAGFISDGFTDREARRLTVALFERLATDDTKSRPDDGESNM